MFLHSDVNAFYVSAELAFRPDLHGRPVVVATNNDGCIAALNREAKNVGLKRGDPLFKIRDTIRRYGVVVFSSNYTLYDAFSKRFHTIVGEYVPNLEAYSIDEVFGSLDGMEKLVDFQTFGEEIRRTVIQHTTMKCGIGIAETKTLCKVATHAAKTWPKTGGVVVLTDPKRRDKLLSLLDVSETWGVGRKIGARLQLMNIRTMLDLARADTTMIRKNFNVMLERTVRELRGERCFELEENPPTKQQLVVSRSFGKRLTSLDEVSNAVCFFATSAGEKLRREKQYCRNITVFIQTSKHDPRRPYYSHGASHSFTTATQDTRDLIDAAVRGLRAIWRDGYEYAKAGVMLGEFCGSEQQLNLFDEAPPRPGSEKLMAVMDKLNSYQRGTLFIAGQGVNPAYQMKREMLSPRYLTRWEGLPIVKMK